MTFWGDDWADDFESWEEVWGTLQDRWTCVDQLGQGLSLQRDANGLLAVEPPGRWRARHRRGLHQLGFRPVAAGRRTVWRWDVQRQLHQVDLSAYASPLESIFRITPPAEEERRVHRLRTVLATEHLVREQVQRVLTEVFRAEPAEVSVLLVRDEEEEWDAS